MIRPFEFRDIPTLHRYRNQGLFLDSARTLTWGRPLVPARALLSYFSSATGVFTSLSVQDGHRPLVGQVVHMVGSPYARFSFLAPDSAIDSPALPALLDNLVSRLGERGAHSLVAEVDESTDTFELLRRAGFSIYARQRIWKLARLPGAQRDPLPWNNAAARDEFAVRALYADLVPALVQQVEPSPGGRLRGLVFHQSADLLAYGYMEHGPLGVWVQPILHPQIERVADCLLDLARTINPSPSRSLYLCVRSYQAWLEHAIEGLGAEVGPRQAVMVKRMTAAIRKPELSPLPKITGTTTEATTPYIKPIRLDRQPRYPV